MFIDFNDWRLFWGKVKWQLISFKFLAFWVFVSLLVFSWISLGEIFTQSIDFSKELYKEGFITKDHVSTIIVNSQKILFDSALSHILTFFGAIMGAIIAIKGISYWTNSEQTKEVIKKIAHEDLEGDDLKKFLPKNGS